MENDIMMIAFVSLLGKAAFIAAFAWVFDRVLLNESARVRIESRSRYALERGRVARHRH